MVGFPKPPVKNNRDSGWNDSLNTLDVFNLLSLDPYEQTAFSEWSTRFKICSKVLHPDKLQGFSPPDGVSMKLLNMVRDWIHAAGDQCAQDARWRSMAVRAKEGWCSTWNATGDQVSRGKPIPAYMHRQQQHASTNSTTFSPKQRVIIQLPEDEIEIIDIVVRERERRPYGQCQKPSSAQEASKKRKRQPDDYKPDEEIKQQQSGIDEQEGHGTTGERQGGSGEQQSRFGRPNTPKSSYSRKWHPVDEAIGRHSKARRTSNEA